MKEDEVILALKCHEARRESLAPAWRHAPRLGIMMFPVGTVRILRLTTFKTSGVARLAHESPATR